MVQSERPVQKPTPELAEAGYFRGLVGKRWCMLRRLPNTYRSGQGLCAFGAVKTQPKSSLTTLGGSFERVFYDDAKAAAKAVRALGEYETLFLRAGGTARGGEVLWEGYTVVDGKVVRV